MFLDATTPSTVETVVEVDGAPRNAAGFDDRVFVRTTDAIAAFDRGAESPRWTTTLVSGAHPGDVPLATADTVLTGTGGGALAALDPETGEQRWRRSIEGTHAFSPTAAGSTAYVTDTDGRLYAMDEETGGVLASVRPDSEANLPGVAAADIDGSPVISESSVSFVAPDGVLVEVSRDDSLSTVERHRPVDHRLAAPPTVVNGAAFASAVPAIHGFSL